MKNLIKLICIIVLSLTVNSCGVSWQIQSVNQAAQVDTLYDVDVITSRSQLNWKMQRDWTFANNYYRFLQQQNYSFFQNQYYYNRLDRFGWNGPHDYWMNWQWNWHSGYSNSWMWNQYPYYGNWGSSQWYYYQNSGHWGYAQMYGPRTHYLGNVYGRRSSNRNRMLYSNSSRSSLLIDSKVSTSEGRTYIPNTTRNGRAHASMIESTIIRNNSKPIVVNKPPVVNNKPIRNNTIRVNNWNARPPVNNNNKPVINNSSSRPNLNSRPSRSSVPKTTTKSSRKPKGN
tara:strand:- start:251 stop:1105 length:855 start_codon:yes stop_codon:yes gene_type:complete